MGRPLFRALWAIFLWTMVPACLSFRANEQKEIQRFGKAGLELVPGFYRVNGIPMHYVQTGLDTLPTIIFIHGTPGSWTAFREYLKDPALLANYRLVSVDRPGFGESDYGYAYHLEEQSILLRPLVDHLSNGKPIYLAGHSLGGPLVVKMAADDPGAYAGIMLISASVDPALEPAESWRRWFAGPPLQSLLPGAFKQSSTELFYFKKDIYPLAADFARITCRVSIVHGDADRWVPVGNAAYARSKLVNARSIHTVIIPGGNHFIPGTHQADITKELIALGAPDRHRP